jgi:hypothetical protein
MPYGQPAQLANLRPPWPKGHKPNTTRRSRDVDKAIALARKYAPQAVRLIGQCMEDPKQPIELRLRCAEFIINKVWPKDVEAALEQPIDNAATRGLEIRFVEPDGTVRSYDEWQARQAQVRQAGREAVDRQPVNERQLPPPRLVEQETPVVPLRASRQEVPIEKVPSFRARNAAGIFR